MPGEVPQKLSLQFLTSYASTLNNPKTNRLICRTYKCTIKYFTMKNQLKNPIQEMVLCWTFRELLKNILWHRIQSIIHNCVVVEILGDLCFSLSLYLLFMLVCLYEDKDFNDKNISIY